MEEAGKQYRTILPQDPKWNKNAKINREKKRPQTPYFHQPSSEGLPCLWGGDIQVSLPPGKTKIIASRPFAYLPTEAEVEVVAGVSESIELRLKPVTDLRARGWYGGDAHIHLVRERRVLIDLATAASLARAEGLDWAAFGADWTSIDTVQPSPAERSALCRRLSNASFLAAWNREHPKDHQGHMTAFPLSQDLDYADVSGQNDFWATLENREAYAPFEIVRSLQKQGTLAVYTHPTREFGRSAFSPANVARGLPFVAVAAPWALEGLDVLTDHPDHINAANLKLWFYLLNRGHRLAACGFSDNVWTREAVNFGDTRTYVKLETVGMEMASIIQAVRRGRTFATTGPLVIFTVDGKPTGSVHTADKDQRQGRVEAWNAVDYHDPRQPAYITQVDVFRNGELWQRHEPEGDQHHVDWTFGIEEAENAWYAVLVRGSRNAQLAVSSPVYFENHTYHAPQPARAVVHGTVLNVGGVPIEGQVLAVEYGKNHWKVVGQAPLRDGEYQIECPATSRIVVEAEGYQRALKSIYIDYDPIYKELLWPIQGQRHWLINYWRKLKAGDLWDTDGIAAPAERLWSESFYREIETRLEDVQLDFIVTPLGQ
jgi:hypothetical protein